MFYNPILSFFFKNIVLHLIVPYGIFFLISANRYIK